MEKKNSEGFSVNLAWNVPYYAQYTLHSIVRREMVVSSSLTMYGTYIPNQKFDLTRISFLRDIMVKKKKIQWITK